MKQNYVRSEIKVETPLFTEKYGQTWSSFIKVFRKMSGETLYTWTRGKNGFSAVARMECGRTKHFCRWNQPCWIFWTLSSDAHSSGGCGSYGFVWHAFTFQLICSQRPMMQPCSRHRCLNEICATAIQPRIREIRTPPPGRASQRGGNESAAGDPARRKRKRSAQPVPV